MSTAAAPHARVLLVDDNADLAQNLGEILSEAGYETRLAGSLKAALAAASDFGFDVALVDVRLPDGDGLALARRLKETHPDGEVVLLTGFATLESAIAAVQAGASAYLVKPCATAELLLAVEQALRHVRHQQEKAELARRAQMSEKLAAVGTLTAGLSHEIRNPLNAAGLQLAVLERRIRKLPGSAQASLLEPLSLVRDEIGRLDHILEDFLQFARPRDFHPRAVAVEPMLNKVLDLMQSDAERRRVRVERAYDGALPPVDGEEERLRQVVMNLALNAMDAASSDGWLRVSAQARGDEIVIAVEDSGKGVPPEVRDRVFEPFFTTKPGGSGLGLPIVHAIVVQHGGAIDVEDAEGGGARFVVRLPRSR